MKAGVHHLNNFHWERAGLCFDNELIIPFGEKWINNVENLRLSNLVRNDRPWEMKADHDYWVNLNVSVS